MKKYKLLKDLPLAKAGTEVFINENINMICKYGDNECVIPIAHIIISEKDEWLEEIPEKPKSVFDLKIGDEYFFLNGAGFQRCVERREIDGDYEMRFYRDRLYYGNVFLTEKEARKELNERIAIQKIKKYCLENDISTEYEFGKNDVVFYLRRGDVVFIGDFQNGNPLGYFSHENAQKILENFEEELKIILE